MFVALPAQSLSIRLHQLVLIEIIAADRQRFDMVQLCGDAYLSCGLADNAQWLNSEVSAPDGLKRSPSGSLRWSTH